MTEVWQLYDATAPQFDRGRERFVGEDKLLHEIAGRLLPRAQVLDLGCGTGRPIARFFLERGHAVTGVDAAPAMIRLCRARFPETAWPGTAWVLADMCRIALGPRFSAIVAWDSFFHLRKEDQRAMFPVFRAHAAPGALLLFTSGPADGEATGDLYGHALYHASLAEAEYRTLLADAGFKVLVHRIEDPDYAGHTVWLAQYVTK